MRKALIAVLALAAAGCATSPNVTQRDAIGNPRLERLTPAEWAEIFPEAPVRLSIVTIVALSRQGMPPDQIIPRYYQTGTRLKLSDVQLAELRKEGVDQRVLDYIASAELDAAKIGAITARADQEARERLSYDRWLYASWWGYPYGGSWGPGVYPYLGYAWNPSGSGWYGGIGIGF